MSIRSILMALTVALSIMLPAASAATAEWVIMRPGDVGAEREFFDTLLQHQRIRCRGCEYDLDNFYIGRFDIDGDGQHELFVVIFHGMTCGSIGCKNPIYQKRNGRWEVIAELDGGFFCEPGPNHFHYVKVEDERIDGHLTLLGAEFGLRWSKHPRTGHSGYFEYFCLTEYCVREWEAVHDEPYTKSRDRIGPREAQCRTE